MTPLNVVVYSEEGALYCAFFESQDMTVREGILRGVLSFPPDVDLSRIQHLSIEGMGLWEARSWSRSHIGGNRFHVALQRRIGQTPPLNHGEIMDSFQPLADELTRARIKFPSNQYMFAALAEEIGEMAEAWLKEGDTPHARKEALQVACVAMRIYTEGVNREGEDKTTLLTMRGLEAHARGFFADLKDRPDLTARSEPEEAVTSTIWTQCVEHIRTFDSELPAATLVGQPGAMKLIEHDLD